MNRAAGRGLARVAAGAACLVLAACGSAPRKAEAPAPTVRIEHHGTAATSQPRNLRSPYAPAQEDPSKRGNYTRGGLYAPGVADSAPTGGIADVDEIPEPEVTDEPHSRYGNRSPYTVLGKTYRVLDSAEGYDEVGTASFYGNKFHGRRTSNLEVYDMYAFTAAHKTLPLPSFARVTNLANGRSVVVRVNDRGPFHDGRIIDLSYAAAVKLGVDRMGTARVEVQGLVPGEDAHVDYDAIASAAATTTAPAPPVAPEIAAEPLPDAPPPAAPLAPGAAPAATAIDRLVAALPIATADASERPPVASAPAASPAMPGMLPASGPSPAAAVAAAVEAPPPGITFQVATFADRGNADRALASVNGAGIAGARLEDGVAAGRAVWRLRVGPVAATAAAELAARLQGLGFGAPQRMP
ncbi:MAG TPA: septal ring lytic transglycosylase RlpA family protein [Luteimonas sp.]|nr:septal ring lytic transglycosylase RlpA family protein [Luteimonas sp.]